MLDDAGLFKTTMDMIHCNGFKEFNLVPFKLHSDAALAHRALAILEKHRNHLTWREEDALEHLAKRNGSKAARRDAALAVVQFEPEFPG